MYILDVLVSFEGLISIEWIASKDKHFFYRGIHLSEKWKKVITNDGKYFE